MSRLLDAVVAVVLGVLVNECTAVSPWLARKVVRKAAAIRRPQRTEVLAEEWSALLDVRPGKLFKLFTALGFLLAALAYRAANPYQPGRPSFLWRARVRAQAAALAGALYAAVWGLIGLFAGELPFPVMIDVGVPVFVISMVALYLPSPKPVSVLAWSLLFLALVLSFWLAYPGLPGMFYLVVITPMYGIAQMVRMTMQGRAPIARIALLFVISTVITGAVGWWSTWVTAEYLYYHSLYGFLALIYFGAAVGLHIGVALLVFDRTCRSWNTEVPGRFSRSAML
ncbi:hypothetical protein ACQPYE_17930 [Actinosynnema sp. CA-299493]